MTQHKTTPSIRGTTPEIERRARELRLQMTPAEILLWQALKGKKVDGLRFRAQHPVGRFILDFYCPECKLVVEEDGGHHDEDTERDTERSAILAGFGYNVVRFTNSEAMKDLAGVLERIRQAAAEHKGVQTRK